MANTSGGVALEGTVVDMPAPQISERPLRAANGFVMAGVATALELAGIALFIVGIAVLATDGGILGLWALVGGILLGLTGFFLYFGLTAVAPGEARVVQLLGRYIGTLRNPGFQWINPITQRRRVSTRIRNHETDVTKVNDADGNPIQIATVVVWQVEDTAQAVFEVDDFLEFVAIQAETAVRHIAGSFPYDAHGEPRLSLRDNAEEINDQLSTEIGVRVASAGVKVIESRIIHLAYAPEIAHAMLRRQQAGAVVAARQRIVEGAVGMVEMALEKLAEHDVVELDEERKAAMVSNLLVVLVGDRDTQPVVNTGTLYQ
ncbi:SPFH domain-containing protein [Nonomuraea fuscirosea]|uniref:SPFH domain-containing protein n=1 Tax=Nonomuraea fuscirosea TaxID=1291556 RepID=UPI0034222C1F